MTMRRKPSALAHDLPRCLDLGVSGSLLLLVLIALAWPATISHADEPDSPAEKALHATLRKAYQAIHDQDLDALIALEEPRWHPAVTGAKARAAMFAPGLARAHTVLEERYGSKLTPELIKTAKHPLAKELIGLYPSGEFRLPKGWIYLDGEHELGKTTIIATTSFDKYPNGTLQSLARVRVINTQTHKQLEIELRMINRGKGWFIEGVRDPGTKYDRSRTAQSMQVYMVTLELRARATRVISDVARSTRSPKAFIKKVDRELAKLEAKLTGKKK